MSTSKSPIIRGLWTLFRPASPALDSGAKATPPPPPPSTTPVNPNTKNSTGRHSPHRSFLSKLFGWSAVKRQDEGLADPDQHDFERDGSHRAEQCRECQELKLMLEKLRDSEDGQLAGDLDASRLVFSTRYTMCNGGRAIGKGASGVVRLAKVKDTCTVNSKEAEKEGSSETLVAVKEFRKRRKGENLPDYVSRVAAEYRIARDVRHGNVVETRDLVRHRGMWYSVMEYCQGGDLYALIKKRSLSEDEINCCFRQVVEGCRYLHHHGIAHRDLKLENLLIDCNGNVKIGDFGVSHVFRSRQHRHSNEASSNASSSSISSTASSNSSSDPSSNQKDPSEKTHGIAGSIPYIAPEEFAGGEYEARLVDVWSLGIIYFALTLHAVPWRSAAANDPHFTKYREEGMASLEPFARLPNGARNLLSRLLEIDPQKRISVDAIYEDRWFRRLKLCPLLMNGEDGPDVDDGSHYEYRVDEVPPLMSEIGHRNHHRKHSITAHHCHSGKSQEQAPSS